MANRLSLLRFLPQPTPATESPLLHLLNAASALAEAESPDQLERLMPGLLASVVEAEGAALFGSSEGEGLTPLFEVGAPVDPVLAAQALAEVQTLNGGAARVSKTMALVSFGEPRTHLLAAVASEPNGMCSEPRLSALSLFASLATAAWSRVHTGAVLRGMVRRGAAALALIREGVVTLDRDDRLLAVNEAAARLLGVSPQEAQGRRLADLSGLSELGSLLAAEGGIAGHALALRKTHLWVRAHRCESGTVVVLEELAGADPQVHRRIGSAARFTFDDLVGSDPAFLACVEAARRAAQVDAPVLVTGESGTGKELFAQAIHNASHRARAPFVAVNVAAIPRELLESELFGYERGAFTGAREGGKAGKFELADRGTLLLDEIGDMPMEMQVKLLRVLQERAIQRLGGAHDLPLRARVIATTHRDLDEAVRAGTFRLDLLHRLRVIQLRLPPLRDRRGDLRALVEHALSRFAPHVRVAPAVLEVLERYDWPGNVRELANVLEGEVSLLGPGETELGRVPASISGASVPPDVVAGLYAAAGGRDAVPDILPFETQERRIIEHALARCEGNVARAARALGLSRGTLYNKIRAYALSLEGRAKAPQDVALRH